MTALPEWRQGTPGVLCVAGPHAIPVSTAVRAGPNRLLLALSSRRESLLRLREDARVALTVVAAGDVAFTAHGRATVVADPLEAAPNVVAVALAVDRVQEHNASTYVVEEGVRWRWTDDEAARRDETVRAALRQLAYSGR